MAVWQEVVTRAQASSAAAVLESPAADDFISRLATKFVADRQQRWWWQVLREPVVAVQYGEAREGLAELRSRLDGIERVNLVVTDEEPDPAGVIAGSPEAVIAIVADLPIFEFAIADPGLGWLIFDTHHNELVIAGVMPLG